MSWGLLADGHAGRLVSCSFVVCVVAEWLMCSAGHPKSSADLLWSTSKKDVVCLASLGFINLWALLGLDRDAVQWA